MGGGVKNNSTYSLILYYKYLYLSISIDAILDIPGHQLNNKMCVYRFQKYSFYFWNIWKLCKLFYEMHWN